MTATTANHPSALKLVHEPRKGLKLNTKEEAATTEPTHPAEEVAKTYRDLALRRDEIIAEMQLAKADLLDMVDAERDWRIRAGEVVGSVKVPTGDGHRVLVVYAEKFKHLAAKLNADALREAFGEQFALVCQVHETVTLKKGTGLAAIEHAIGAEAFEKLAPLLSTKDTITPRKGAGAVAAQLFRDGDEAADDLLAFLDETLYAPQLRTK